MKLYAFLRFVTMLSYCGAFVKIDVSKSSKNLTIATELSNVSEVAVSSTTTIAVTTKAPTTTVSSTTKAGSNVATLTTPTPQKVATLKPDSINETRNESVSIYEWPPVTGGVHQRQHTPEDYYCACDLTVSMVNDGDLGYRMIVNFPKMESYKKCI